MEALDEATERRFLTGVRPDGPVVVVFRASEDGEPHVVVVHEVCGRDEGVFIARCYSCDRFERFMARRKALRATARATAKVRSRPSDRSG